MDLDSIKNKAVPILMAAGVIRSSVFGSFVRGDNNVNSDVDFLIEFPKGKTLFDLVSLKLKLEETLDKKVDLVTFRSISPYLKDSVLKDQYSIL